MNLILNTDSYKASHWLQYPKNTKYVFSYIESRGSERDHDEYDETVMKSTQFFGLQAYLKEYLSKPITQDNIDEAFTFFSAHGEPFNKEGWEYILKEHNGYMPVKIKAVAEGVNVPTKNVLVTIENTDPECFWLPSYLETSLLRAVWYPTTVSSISKDIKNVIKEYLELTADNTEGLLFKLNDFSPRGVSSYESSQLGGMGHLINFLGSDNVLAAVAAMRYYNTTDMPAFSIPAAEHSTITSWGKENEAEAYRNMLTNFANPGAILAVVSDSYDIYNACENLWGKELKQEVINSGATVVIRPDSGDPVSVVVSVLSSLASAFGFTVNSKGYKVLPDCVRVIQGDGIDRHSIRKILHAVKINNFSADNITFGMGGALLQHMNRDTFKFAMKCSAMKVDEKWIDVYKDPITDKGKVSKKGRITLVKDKNCRFKTVRVEDVDNQVDMLHTVFENGKIVKEYTLEEVRANSNFCVV